MDQFLVLYSLFGPFLVWPLEYYFPYPYVVEELFKSILVFCFTRKSTSSFILAGIAFALTETVFYSFNINALGNIGLLFTRFILTSILHSLTFLVIYWFTKIDRKLIIGGFILAVLIHYTYNKYIPIY